MSSLLIIIIIIIIINNNNNNNITLTEDRRNKKLATKLPAFLKCVQFLSTYYRPLLVKGLPKIYKFRSRTMLKDTTVKIIRLIYIVILVQSNCGF